jgi:hypothetical protein
MYGEIREIAKIFKDKSIAAFYSTIVMDWAE